MGGFGNERVVTDDVDLEILYGLTADLVRETLAAIGAQDRARLKLGLRGKRLGIGGKRNRLRGFLPV